MTEIKATVKALGKYKEKFNSTGFLLVKGGKEVWVDIPGQHDYKVYKGHEVTVKAQQNAKGYWSGTLVHPQGQADGDPFSQPTKQPAKPASSSTDYNKNKEKSDSELRSFAISYAKDLVNGKSIGIADMYSEADSIFDWMKNKPVTVDEPQVQSNPDYEDGGQPEDDEVPF